MRASASATWVPAESQLACLAAASALARSTASCETKPRSRNSRERRASRADALASSQTSRTCAFAVCSCSRDTRSRAVRSSFHSVSSTWPVRTRSPSFTLSRLDASAGRRRELGAPARRDRARARVRHRVFHAADIGLRNRDRDRLGARCVPVQLPQCRQSRAPVKANALSAGASARRHFEYREDSWVTIITNSRCGHLSWIKRRGSP